MNDINVVLDKFSRFSNMLNFEIIECIFEKKGYKKIFLTVDSKFLIAIKFYEKRGFIFDYFDKKNKNYIIINI